MRKFTLSLLVLASIFLGNLSAQAKAFRIFDHIASEHSVQKKDIHEHHHHHGGHSHHHKHASKKKTQKEHSHSAELSLSGNSLSFPSATAVNIVADLGFRTQTTFFYKEIVTSSFLDSIFRPPIA